MVRKIIQIATAFDPGVNYGEGIEADLPSQHIVALCDDGTVWTLFLADDNGRDQSYQWAREPGIPQDEEK